MVTLDDIQNILGNSTPTKGNVSLGSLALLQSVSNVTLEMDRSTMDYYYALDIDSITNEKSEIIEDTLKELRDSGWCLNLENNQIIKYI